MSRKDYRRVAKMMREVLDSTSIDPESWLYIVHSLAVLFKEDNARFDLHKFRDACGWNTCTGVASEST